MESFQPEKSVAVQKFIQNNVNIIEANVVGGVVKEPEFIAQNDLRDAAIKYGIRLYKLSMYAKGVSPSNILTGVQGLTRSATEGTEGALKAIFTSAACAKDLLVETGNARGLNNQRVLVTRESARPNIHELIRTKPV